ncbi:hypothetical protein K432DRAFT_383977 [Lepidopterella palustris CBS 459.81]|uniref:Uncharacterized protein n=1 Tax=Lepidopterella palustris CBS 459.81 TaxID=1314670 RepID=A0A8E2JD71_9PEZI|nr:hypothetical protein K432DRAFT_383977 [Lepidopterella palustris CBS 459.81]
MYSSAVYATIPPENILHNDSASLSPSTIIIEILQTFVKSYHQILVLIPDPYSTPRRPICRRYLVAHVTSVATLAITPVWVVYPT